MNIADSIQINYINDRLKANRLSNESLRNEVMDHVICKVEDLLVEGSNFHDAVNTVLEEFDLQAIEKNRQKLLQRKILSRTKNVSLAIVVLLFTMVIGVDAQEKPDIHPLGNGYKTALTFGDHTINGAIKKQNGIDIIAPFGTKVLSAARGEVVIVDASKDYGNYIIVKHNNEFSTLYASLSEIKVEEGAFVKKGDNIALSGKIGSSKAHLHYEIFRNNECVDPESYLSED
ncbi:MAG TPA: M23 family metallopeptidase [Cyclobacteriaceae bacterium]